MLNIVWTKKKCKKKKNSIVKYSLLSVKNKLWCFQRAFWSVPVLKARWHLWKLACTDAIQEFGFSSPGSRWAASHVPTQADPSKIWGRKKKMIVSAQSRHDQQSFHVSVRPGKSGLVTRLTLVCDWAWAQCLEVRVSLFTGRRCWVAHQPETIPHKAVLTCWDGPSAPLLTINRNGRSSEKAKVLKMAS